MNHRAYPFATCLFVIFVTGVAFPAYAGLRDNNLIEFSHGAYPNHVRGHPDAMLYPPYVKIYQDGKVIYFDDSHFKFYVARLDAQELDTLKKRLSTDPYLRKSRFIEMDGDDINVHGGVSYIRYLDGDKETLLATEVHPQRGPWVQLTELIGDYVPEKREPYYPSVIEILTWEDVSQYTNQNPPAWPFTDEPRLGPKLKTVSSPEIIRYLFERLNRVFSFFVWEFSAGGKRYALALAGAPGWFDQKYINKALAKVRKNGYVVKER